jgi:hypothetical protein
LFDTLRAHVLSHPLLLVGICLIVHRAAAGRLAAEKVAGTFAANVPAAWVFFVLFGGIVTVNVAVSAYGDHVEPSVAALSWAVMQGQDAYPPPDAPALYGLPYGPMLYLLNGVVMKIAGPGISASKLLGGVTSVGSLILIAIAARRAHGDSWPRVLSWTAIVYLAFGSAAFWVRAEPLLMLCSSIAVLSLTLGLVPAAIAMGIAVGVGINLKISAFIYLVPAIVVVLRKHGSVALAVTAGVAAIVTALPFIVFDNISATGYLHWVRSTAAHGFRLRALPTALEWATFAAIPLALFARSRQEHLRQMSWLLVLMIFVSVPLAAKHGTGAYHFLPFVPLVLFAAGGKRDSVPARMPALLAASLVLGAFQLSQWMVVTTGLPGSQILSELQRIELTSRGTIAMGYSRNYRLTFFRPQLVFDGHPNVLDGASAMDAAWSRRPFPRRMIDGMKSCDIDTWVIPAGGAPFELPNAYGSAEVFPEEFRAAFLARYQRRESGRWFDVWSCAR